MDGAVEIAYNTSQNYGGGISASEGALVTVESGTIHDNTALGQGGGVWVRGGSVFAMNGGSDVYKRQDLSRLRIFLNPKTTFSPILQ